ncbi:hypothetical protein [Reinekea blandensis]|uniref:Uncharacterized protein n=1 Tax=Reinekea blandensis MED297 TaxID=314283 RepID=A4BKD3_9GAMM|nr:hypothetical protein [Reinekea blandensis]EAR07438.1 hypothetical protein MED297_19102 [Reinekea sp. MED297] [Reinekea blandensis MED297]
MQRLIVFTVLSNLLALMVVFLLRVLVASIAAMKPIDLMFLTGVAFWLVSSVIRLSTKRLKKEWNRNEMELTDPQLVISTESLSARFLIAGAFPLLGAVIWGFFY